LLDGQDTIFLTLNPMSQLRLGYFMTQAEKTDIGIRPDPAGETHHMASELIKSTDEYHLYKTALGLQYIFHADCNSGEFRGQKAGTSVTVYPDGVPPREIVLGRKYSGG
jgi:hypothetical protein